MEKMEVNDQNNNHSMDEDENNNNGGQYLKRTSYLREKPLKNGCEDTWTWNRRDRSQEALLSGPGNRTVHFHPNWSKGTAGIRGTRVLNNGRYYWELKLSDRIFGTRYIIIIVFNIGTRLSYYLNCKLINNCVMPKN